MSDSKSAAPRLEPHRIALLAQELTRRVQERFPGRGLTEVARLLLNTADAAERRSERLARPNLGIRGAVAVILAFFVLSAASLLTHLKFNVRLDSFQHLVQLLQPTIELGVFLGAAAAFLVSLEARWKRGAVFAYLQELRALAHLIDMHQLNKDPERFREGFTPTESSPDVGLSPDEMARYLDYCSEMLAVTSKLGALAVQDFKDAQAIAAVDELESLSTGLARKIWQKIILLQNFG